MLSILNKYIFRRSIWRMVIVAIICLNVLDPVVSGRAESPHSLKPAQESRITIYGPRQFVREKGEPKTVTDKFEMPEGVLPPFRLFISNGDGNKKNQIPSTAISVNDQLIFNGRTNKWREDPMVFDIDLEKENTLSIKSVGQPGSFLTIWITAEVDQTPPAITISSPSEGAIFNVDEVTVSGTIVDESPTTVTVNGVEATVTDNQVFRAVVPLASDGEHVLTATATDAAGNTSEASLTVIRDTTPPIITLLSPAEGLITSDQILTVTGTISDPTPTQVDVNGTSLPVDSEGNFSGTVSLVEGLNELTVTATDSVGNSSSISRAVRLDTIPPILKVDSPLDGETVDASTVVVSGTVQDATSVTVSVNGTVFATTDGGAFTGNVPLVEGPNKITIVATDAAGNTATLTITVSTSNQPPIASFTFAPKTGEAPLEVTFDASASSDPDGSIASYEWDFGDGQNGNGVSVVHTYVSANTYTVMLTVTDDGKAYGSTSLALIVTGEILPPDPADVAPPLDRTRTTCLAEATEFLYTASNPIQTGVDPNALGCQRGAVLRGRVLTRDGMPLPGVTITILDHPEFGQTLSRADGMFDLAVSGGGVLVVNYERDGYLPSQRPVNARWQDYAWLPDVVLIPVDAQVTTIDLTSGAAMQVVRGNAVSDGDGTRQATLFIPQGTQAEMVLPGGVTQTLTTFHVRATEYTVGDTGPEAMPGELPPSSGYTYALEYSVDEAVSAEATGVRFSQPVLHYIENFLAFPVGTSVPTGSYDRERGTWIGSPNGRVIKIMSITDGLVDLDTDGDGTADNGVGLGVTEAEQQQLAALYQPGQSLWRVPITHFSPLDCNWPYGPSPDARPPQQRPPRTGNPVTDPCLEKNSIIECENQILRERVSIVGTPFSLNYASDRAAGGKPTNTLDISLSGPALPTGVKGIELGVQVAGQRSQQLFPAAPNQRYVFTWDGQDAYGRTLQGATPIAVQIGYVYDAVYQEPAQLAQAFAALSGVPITGNRARQEVTLWQEWQGVVGSWNTQPQGLGTWTLNVHHVYDPEGKVLYLGNGERRSADDVNLTIRTIAGKGSGGYGDGIPATQAQLGYSPDVVVGPDGSLYVVESSSNRIRRIGSDGIITTVAGNGTLGFSGDGGPATQAQLNNPQGVAVGPDGSLYIAEGAGTYRVRRVGPDGIITTFAGDGLWGYNGDGIPAAHAHLTQPNAVAVGPDGSLYIADSADNRIRRVGPDGIITTVAGNGTAGSSGDGGPATQARLRYPIGLTVGPDGSLYFADFNNNRIRRVGPDGIIATVAGNGTAGSSGDGGPATQAQLRLPHDVAVGPDGSLYLADSFSNRIRRVRPDGTITGVAGNGTGGFSGDGGPATQASLHSPYGVAVGPDGSLYFADTLNYRIGSVAPSLPGSSITDFIIPAEDGSELYVFDSQGRHLRTLGGLTGAVRYQFDYDSAGRLAQVTDRDGLVTRIERDASGNPTAIVGPYSQRTTLGVDAQGYLASIANPAGETTRLAYTPNGLLTQLIDPRGGVHTFTYDAAGRLTRDTNPAGGFISLDRLNTSTGYTVTLSNALGVTTQYGVETLSTGDQRRTQIRPDGLTTVWLVKTNGTRDWSFADRTSRTLTLGPDPRWGMQAPLNQLISTKTPSGLTFNAQTTSSATLTNPLDPFSLSALNYTVDLNGQKYNGSYTAATRTFSDSSPAGRTITTTLNSLGRLIFQQLAGLAPTSYQYDSNGRLSAVSLGTGPETRTLNLSYNSAGYLSKITDPIRRSRSFAYDAAGRITSETLPDGQVVSYTYDANGNLASLTPPGRPAHTIEYNAADLPTRYTPPDVNPGTDATSYLYNAAQQLAQITRPDGQVVNASYDSAGRLSSLTTPRGAYSYTYNPAIGSITGIFAPGGIDLAFTYDGQLLTRQAWSGPITGSASFTYNNDMRASSISVNNANPIAYEYNPDGLLIQAGTLTIGRNLQTGLLTGSTLGTITDSWNYDSFAEPALYSAAYNGAAMYIEQNAYDSVGRTTQKTETLGATTDTYDYQYDQAGRLTEVTKNAAPLASYTYDSNGNRLSYTGSGGTLTATYDAQDRMLTYGSQAYTYTANGELQSKSAGGQTTTYQYDALGNLLFVSLPSGKQISYLVDGQNRRIGRQVNGTLAQGFLYQDGLRPVAELDASNQLVSRFIYAARVNVPDYLIKNGVTYRIIADTLGSPRLVVNTATGEIVQRIDYDPFGSILSDTNPGFQPFGFAGGLYDRDTGLLRFGARDYDPQVGRWTAKDPIWFRSGDTNLYAYVGNDPVNRRDPAGLDSQSGGVCQKPKNEAPKKSANCPPGGLCIKDPKGGYYVFKDMDTYCRYGGLCISQQPEYYLPPDYDDWFFRNANLLSDKPVNYQKGWKGEPPDQSHGGDAEPPMPGPPPAWTPPGGR
jgi:RHS repeat-associated protein